MVKLQRLVERGLALSAKREVEMVPFPEGDAQTTLTLMKCVGSSDRGT